MSHKEVIDDVSAEMRRLKDREIQDLDAVDNLNLTEEGRRLRRAQIIDIFHTNMARFKSREGYEEALNSLRKMKYSGLKRKNAEKDKERAEQRVKQAKQELDDAEKKDKERAEQRVKQAKQELDDAEKIREEQYDLYKKSQLEYGGDAKEIINGDF